MSRGHKGQLKMINGRTLQHLLFIKIMKDPGTSFQSPALSQNKNVCHTTY